MRTDYLHVEVGVGDVVPNLVDALARHKDGVGPRVGDLPGEGEPGGDPDEVLLRDAQVEETLRVLRAECRRLQGGGGVCAEDDDSRVRPPHLREGLPEGVPHRPELLEHHFTTIALNAFPLRDLIALAASPFV